MKDTQFIEIEKYGLKNQRNQGESSSTPLPIFSSLINIFSVPLLFPFLPIFISNLFQPPTIENPPLFSVDTPSPSLQVEQTEVLVTPRRDPFTSDPIEH